MKKVVSLILCALMLLSLTACSEEAKLYEKYADIITMLEEENYTGVMGAVSAMAVAKQNEGKERPALVTVMEGQWYMISSDYTGAPEIVTMRQDGTCVVDGKEMLWLERHSDDTRLEGYIMDGGEYKYCFGFRVDAEDLALPRFELWTCRVDGEEVYSDNYVGNYKNTQLYTVVAKWWRLLDGDAAMDDSFDMYDTVWYDDISFKWKFTSAEGEMPAVIKATSDNGSGLTLTLSLEERDGHKVMRVTNDATGETGLYYNEDDGYEESWPEYKYPKVLENLRRYLRDGYFWVDGMEGSLRDNTALTYLHEQFTALGDYKDSADYLARFSMIPSMLTKMVQHTTDQLGNVSDSNKESHTYNNQGQLIAGSGAQMIETFGIYEDWSTFYLEYDASGKVSKINIGKDPVNAVCTPTYNAAGQLETMHVQRTDRQYTSTFTYDDQGRVIQLEIPYSTDTYSQYVYTYTYDDAGHLTEKVRAWSEGRYKEVYTFTYEGDALVQSVMSYQYRDKEEYAVTRVFTNDAQGRPVSAVETSTRSGDTYAARELEYQYQDLYFFDDTGIVLEENN